MRACGVSVRAGVYVYACLSACLFDCARSVRNVRAHVSCVNSFHMCMCAWGQLQRRLARPRTRACRETSRQWRPNHPCACIALAESAIVVLQKAPACPRDYLPAPWPAR
jgi:hypothetical protein